MGIQFNAANPNDWSLRTEIEEVDTSNANARRILEATGLVTPLDPTGQIAVVEAEEWYRAHGESVPTSASLGIETEDELSGCVPAGFFREHALLALAFEPEDEGIPWAADPQNSRWIECGRSPGLIQQRLEQLLALAEAAEKLGPDWCVCWG